MSKRNILQFCK